MATFLCVSGYFKGEEFLRACKAAGNTVYLVTSKKLEHKPWPRESIDEIFYMQEDEEGNWHLEDLIGGTAYLMRSRKIDRFVSLDDFDVEKVAALREHFRIPGMGQTTARYFRDKLAMRVKAQSAGIRVPAFSPLFNDADIHEYTQRVSPPWVVKPRGEASATGISKVYSSEQLWDVLHKLGDRRHQYLIEQFKPGDVYHSDAITINGKVLFVRNSKYLATPMEVAHGGGVFRSITLPFGGKEDKALQRMNSAVLKGFGMQYSASHTEFIRCHDDGEYYFLETSSRVGGAHLAEMVEASSGINLWREWAKIESAIGNATEYILPEVRNDYAGIIISLSRFERPDHSSFTDPEIVWRIDKDHHIGFIVRSADHSRVAALLDEYMLRVQRDFHASAPPPSKSAH